MSAADEDTELRDLLVQTLDKNGVLGKIKAELRASIFLALEAQEQNKTQNPLKNTNLQKFAATEDGRTCVGIVNQFLNHFHLDYTAAVFGPEAEVNDATHGEKEIEERLKLEQGDSDSPLLLRVIQGSKSKRAALVGLQDSQIQFLRSKFKSFDHTNVGSIDRKDVTAVIGHACPTVNVQMLDKFVTDELENSYSSPVSFDAFMNLFRKFYDMCASVISVGGQGGMPPAILSMDKKTVPDSFYVNQTTPFHQVPASPTPMSEPKSLRSGPTADTGSIPSAYLLPTNSPPRDGGMDVGYDPFFDTRPGTKPEENLHARSGDALYTDRPATSPSSSQTGSDWPNKKLKTGHASEQQYEDDFQSEQSISEDIQEMGDDLLQSSEKEESLDLTEDRTVSEIPHADYMEDIRHS